MDPLDANPRSIGRTPRRSESSPAYESGRKYSCGSRRRRFSGPAQTGDPLSRAVPRCIPGLHDHFWKACGGERRTE